MRRSVSALVLATALTLSGAATGPALGTSMRSAARAPITATEPLFALPAHAPC